MTEIPADLKVGMKILVFDRTYGKMRQPREAVITKIGRTLVTAEDAGNPSWSTWTFQIATQASKSGFQRFRTIQQHQYDEAKAAAWKNLRAHGLDRSDRLADLHLFAVSKLLTELDGVVAEVEGVEDASGR